MLVHYILLKNPLVVTFYNNNYSTRNVTSKHTLTIKVKKFQKLKKFLTNFQIFGNYIVTNNKCKKIVKKWILTSTLHYYWMEINFYVGINFFSNIINLYFVNLCRILQLGIYLFPRTALLFDGIWN